MVRLLCKAPQMFNVAIISQMPLQVSTAPLRKSGVVCVSGMGDADHDGRHLLN